MSRPDVGVTTERLYARLPEFYRQDDLDDGDYPLLRYVSLWMDQASEVETTLDDVRLNMANPLTARAEWLPWLAQMVGIDYAFDETELVGAVDSTYLSVTKLTVGELRATIADASTGWRSATRASVIAAVQTQLTGTKRVWTYTGSTGEPAGMGAGTPWDLLIVTVPEETPSPTAVLDAIERLQAKPAGVKLWHRQYESSWAKIELAHTTWDAIEALGSWRALEETGIND